MQPGTRANSRIDVGRRAKPLSMRRIVLVFDFRLAMCVEIKEIKVHEMRKTLDVFLHRRKAYQNQPLQRKAKLVRRSPHQSHFTFGQNKIRSPFPLQSLACRPRLLAKQGFDPTFDRTMSLNRSSSLKRKSFRPRPPPKFDRRK